MVLGNGATSRSLVLSRPNGFYDVQDLKRYARPGRYSVTVTMTAEDGRRSLARSRAVVTRRR